MHRCTHIHLAKIVTTMSRWPTRGLDKKYIDLALRNVDAVHARMFWIKSGQNLFIITIMSIWSLSICWFLLLWPYYYINPEYKISKYVTLTPSSNSQSSVSERSLRSCSKMLHQLRKTWNKSVSCKTLMQPLQIYEICDLDLLGQQTHMTSANLSLFKLYVLKKFSLSLHGL